MICLGSTKSNPVVELVLANAFGAEPFSADDAVRDPRARRCPIFLRFRTDDPHPASCCGGVRLSANTASETPGIYFEQADGTWANCSWDAQHSDAAFVFYIHRESQGRLEMALGGFSGRATRLLAKTLATRAEDVWPPNYQKHGLQVGAFIVQYSFSQDSAPAADILRTDLVANTKIIPLPAESIARRMKGTHAF